MQESQGASRGHRFSKKFSRANKILALIPKVGAPSDIENNTSSSDEEQTITECYADYYSSDAPSISTSLEELNLLAPDSPDVIEDSDQEIPVPITPIIRKIFPNPTQVNYDNIPSLSSIASISSPALQDIPPTPCAPTTRSKRKLGLILNTVRKKHKKLPPIQYSWKKAQFRHKAIIPKDEFIFDMTGDDSPLDYFSKYFSIDIFQDIVLNTNLYSVQNTGKSINLTENELRDFISILLIMGVVSMPSYLDYWSNKLRYANIANTMTLKRFQQIRRYLHFVDNSCSDSDRFYKVRPLIEKIRRNCLATEEELRYSIDEMTIPYKGKKAGNRKQYNPMKPNKWGFKNIVRAGISGIVYDFILYAGEDTFRYINFSEIEENMTLGAKLVTALCKTIQTKASVVYYDNYFSTLDLSFHLRDSYGLFSLGTIRQNRLRGCEKLLMSDKDMKKKGRGTFSQMVDNERKLAVVKWYDNKVVTLVSSYADAYPVQKIKRYSKESKSKIDVDCPCLIKHYNQHMGGVDLCDMLIALYRIRYRSRRWYSGIFAQMLDICVNNAWLLYRRNCSGKGTPHTNLKTFRIELVKELQQTGRSSELHPSKNDNVPIIQTPIIPRPLESVRCDGVGHWQGFTSYGRCRYCTKNKTEVYCIKCNQRLCFVRKRNCFYNFHCK